MVKFLGFLKRIEGYEMALGQAEEPAWRHENTNLNYFERMGHPQTEDKFRTLSSQSYMAVPPQNTDCFETIVSERHNHFAACLKSAPLDMSRSIFEKKKNPILKVT